MKRLYGDGIINMIPVSGGFIFAIKQSAYDDKIVVAYKLYSFDSGTVSPIKKNVYIQNKFGDELNASQQKLTDHINSSAIVLPDKNRLVCHYNGDASIYDHDGNVAWAGRLVHKDEGAFGLAVHDGSLWCTFPNAGVVLKYTLNNMKEDIRLGGGAKPDFISPEGIWSGDTGLLVCSAGAKKIFEIDTNSYSMEEYAEFDEKVHQYIKVNSNEIVLLDSGAYRI